MLKRKILKKTENNADGNANFEMIFLEFLVKNKIMDSYLTPPTFL